MRVGLCLGAAFILVACQPPAEVNEEVNREDIKSLAVTGVGEVKVMPDQFVLSGAVIKQADTSKQAMNELADVVNAIQQAATTSSNLNGTEFNFASVNTNGVKDPECLLFNKDADRTNGSLRQSERRVKKKVCNDIAQQASISFNFIGGPSELAGNALSAFSQAGAIRLTLDGYKIENIEEIELQAGEKAIANAREKADRLAAAGGAKIIGVVDLDSYEPTYNQQTAQAPRINTSGAGESSQLVDGGDPVEVTDMNLDVGMQVISAAVRLEFIYE